MQDDDEITTVEIAQHKRMSEPTVLKLMNKLVEQGEWTTRMVRAKKNWKVARAWKPVK